MRTLSGRVVGRHDGLMYYTLGQRRGLGIGGMDGEANGGRWFVLAKDMEHNVLIVERGEDHPLLYAHTAIGEQETWIAGEPPVEEGGTFACTAKFRYRQADQEVEVTREAGRLIIRAKEKQRAITPGQSAVFYRGEECLGGAIVTDVLDAGK